MKYKIETTTNLKCLKLDVFYESFYWDPITKTSDLSTYIMRDTFSARNSPREITVLVLRELSFWESRGFKNVFPRKVQFLKKTPKTVSFQEDYLWHNFSATMWRSRLRHCAISRKVAVSIPDGFTGSFNWHNPSACTMTLGPNVTCGVKRPVLRGYKLTTFLCRFSWNLGASTCWNPQGLSKDCVTFFYICIYITLWSVIYMHIPWGQ